MCDAKHGLWVDSPQYIKVCHQSGHLSIILVGCNKNTPVPHLKAPLQLLPQLAADWLVLYDMAHLQQFRAGLQGGVQGWALLLTLDRIPAHASARWGVGQLALKAQNRPAQYSLCYFNNNSTVVYNFLQGPWITFYHCSFYSQKSRLIVPVP